MKVFMYTAFYYPHVSGLTYYFQRLAESLVKNGHEVTMLTAQHDKFLPIQEVINGVKVVRSKYLFKFNKGLFLPFIWLDAFRTMRDVDVVHLNLPAFDSPIIAIIAKLLRKRIVSTYVCDITLPKFIGSSIFDWIIDLNHRFVLRLSDKLASFTNDFANHSRVMKHFKSETLEVYPQVELPTVTKEITKLNKLKQGNCLVIGMATRIAAEKGVDLVISALEQVQLKIPNAKVVIAGSTDAIGEEVYMEKINKLVKQKPNDIVLLGRLSIPEMVYFYQNIDVLVVASTNSTEAFGMVQVEAMLNGTPCIASNLPGVRIPIKLTEMGEVVKIGDVNDLAKKMIMVLSEPKKYHKSPEQIHTIFSDESTINQYLAIYESARSK